MIRRRAAVAAALLALAAPARSQLPPHLPFEVGERLEYAIKFGFVPIGGASMELTAVDTVGGRLALHAVFSISGGIPGCSVNDRLESWIDIATISALRFKQDIHECHYDRQRLYEFLPEKQLVIEGHRDTSATVHNPLDEASFLYFIRTINLPPGLDTGFYNYFIPDRNPIRIRVLKRERIRVPAGEFDAILIQPLILSKGLFSEGGQAQVWLSDDPRHLMLQLKSRLPGFGSLNLYLRSIRPK